MQRDYPDRPFLGVGAIIAQDGRILLVRRRNPPLQNEWSIPGGIVETGETTKQAIVREVQEETGLLIEPVKLVEVFERIVHDDENRVQYHYVLIDYLCSVISGDPHATSDVTDLRWTAPEELESYAVRPETCAVICKALNLRESDL